MFNTYTIVSMTYSVTQQIDKFLKFQQNIRSCSEHTLRAYRLDLSQAFKMTAAVNKKSTNNLIQMSDFKHLRFSSSQELWLMCRESLSQWGHLSLASRNRKIATIKSFFNWMYDEKIIDKNYADQLICPKVPKKIPHFISVDEVISVIKYLSEASQKDQSALSQYVLFVLLYGGGLRISEACSLKWKSIDLDSRKILVLGKGNKERYISLPQFCIDVLTKYKNKEKTEFVFGTEPLSTRKGYELIRQAGSSATLMSPLHPHSLRHSYATHMLASGANLRTLQSLLGHDSLQATEKYTHLNIDSLARLVEANHPLSKKTQTKP